MSLRLDLAVRFLHKSPLLRCCSANCLKRMTTMKTHQLHTAPVLYDKSQADKSIDEKMSQTPYPFMSSLKGDVQSRQEAIDYEEEWPYQSLVIFASITSFLIYFTLIRKEREVDKAIGETLYKGLPALEVADLRKAIKKNQDEGKDTTEMEARLKVVLTPPQNRNL